MAKAIKFEIIRKWPDVRGIDVHYYTDELLAAIQPKWTEVAAWYRANSGLSEAEIQERLRREHPAGKFIFLTIPKVIATAVELAAYILERSPYEDMMTKEECLIAPPDMSIVDQLMTASPDDAMLQGVPERIEIAEIEAEMPAPIPIL